MDISPRKASKKAIEPMDDWLKVEGYFRKSSPKDPTCLFRAVSEQIYMTQYYHVRVRKECVEFMRKSKHIFKENIAVPMDNYLEQLSCVTEWGGMNEIEAMSRLYKREFIVFYGQKMMKKNVTNNGYDKSIYLCHTAPRHYEAVYEREIIAKAAFCQSLVYQTLYKDVFQMSGIDEIVQKMLHDRPINTRHDRFFLKNNVEIRDQLATELFSKIDGNGDENSDEMSFKGNAPFPYRVAKALDPNIYRNTDFDIWHEMKREVRCAGWVRWNNSELQVGGKCLVQMDYKRENSDETNNNNFQSIMDEQDKNGNVSQSQAEKSMKKDSPSSPLCIGHIQEMSKNEGPVIVFIEELGEKKTVPYGALKPLQEPKKPKSPTSGSILPRRNMSYDQFPKWKKQWSSNTRKPKESITNASYSGLDRVNNNRNETSGNNKKDTLDNSSWSDISNVKHNATILEQYTNLDNFSPGGGYSTENTFEVRPVAVVLDNSQPVKSSTSDTKEDVHKTSSPSLSNANKNNSNDKHQNNNTITENANFGQTMAPQQAPPPPPNEPFYPPHSGMSGPPMYPGNLNVVCVSPDGNVYAPLPFYGGNFQSSGFSASNGPMDRTNQMVNLAVQMSVDINGSDLPYSDPATLRFFFNLGLEYFRFNQMWAPNGPPVAYTPGFIPQGNMVPSLPPPEAPPANENVHLHQGNAPRPAYPHNRRKVEQTHNQGPQGRMSNAPGNSRSNYPRKDSQEGNKARNESPNSSNEFQRLKISNSGNERGKDFNYGNWEPRRNTGPGRFKRNNDNGRYRTDKPVLFQHDSHQRPSNGPHGNKSQNFGNSDTPNQFQRGNKPEGGYKGQTGNAPQAQQSVSMPSTPYQPQYNETVTTMLPNVPYYMHEVNHVFPGNPNAMHPMPYITHSDVSEGNNVGPYVCTGSENYPQAISPVYTPIPYPPPPLYSVPAQNPQESWYTVPGQPQFVPYPQIPVSQPSSTMSGTPTST